MKIQPSPILRKALWLFLAAFLLLAQLASAAEVPALTGLTEDELLTMPTVSIAYQIETDGELLTLDATPALSPQGKAYWAMLPVEAFSFPMTLTITASETAPYTFTPMSGELLETDVNTLDYEGLSTLITAYQNDEMVDTYRLYISTAALPLDVEPAEVPVYYVDAEDNSNVLHYEVILAYYGESNIVTADTALVPANYALMGDSSATVTVDETGTASPAWVTFYFQVQILQGTLHIYYTDASGNELATSQTRTLDPGDYTITPEPADLPADYVLTAESPTSVDITVDELGNISQSVVTFFYEPKVTTGYLTVNYCDENNVPLIGAETLELSTGTHTVTPNVALAPPGYVLSGISQTQFDVIVDSDGIANPSAVTFYYAPEQVTPVTGPLAVFYMKTDNTPLIPSETRTLEQGQHTVTPTASSIPEGYVLTADSPAEYSVTVGADGSVSPASVTFFYEQPQAVTGTLTIQYIDTKEALIGTAQTTSLSVGTHTVGIDTATIPSGYVLDASSPTEFNVTVSESGVTTPDTIAFILTTSQAATTMVKKATAWPSSSPCMRAKVTKARLPALSINSTHMNMTMALRRSSTPAAPMVNSSADRYR